jgi:hypothetical protein
MLTKDIQKARKIYSSFPYKSKTKVANMLSPSDFKFSPKIDRNLLDSVKQF